MENSNMQGNGSAPYQENTPMMSNQPVPQQNNMPNQAMPQQNGMPNQPVPQQNNMPNQAMPRQYNIPNQAMPQYNMRNGNVPLQYGMPYQNYQKPIVKHPHESAARYAIMGIPVIVYALLCAFCLYRNWSGIMTPIFTIISALFISFGLVKYEQYTAGKNGTVITISEALSKQKKLIFYFVGMLLFGIAVCLTADGIIIFICNSGILVLEIFGLLGYFYDTKSWSLFKAFLAFFDVIVIAPFEYISEPFVDYSAYRKENNKKGHKVIYVLIGTAIAIPILALVLKLLTLADEVFKSVLNSILGSFIFSPDIILFAAFVFAIFMFAYGIIVKIPRSDINYLDSKRSEYEPVIGITVTGILTLFYLLFSVIQILYLFINNMELPNGMSYAKYARHGFFQLLFVAILNLIIVLLCIKLFRKSKVLNVVLVIMSICTYIMIFSSAIRMLMYIDQYDLTYARVFVIFMLIMTAILMTGVVVRIFSDTFPLFNYSFWVIMLLFIIFAFFKPASFIAEYNLNSTDGSEIDIKYVAELGSDAVPALCEYFEDNGYGADFELDGGFWGFDFEFGRYLNNIINKNEKYGKIRGFNLSRYSATKYAKDFLEKYPVPDKY
ncbi:MAG: DUF4153 domain-containing protein [Coprococcus sp.]